MTGGLLGVLKWIGALINQALPLIISLTVLVFVWGLFKLVMAGDSEDSRAEARGYITCGVVALFVMVSVWGLVNILIRSFNLQNSMPAMPAVPDVGGGNGGGGGGVTGGYTGGDVNTTQGYSNVV
jgi:hypothetical protein